MDRLNKVWTSLCLTVVGLAMVAPLTFDNCGPVNPPPSDGGPVSTPTSWVDTAQVATDVLIVAVPSTIPIVQALPIPAQTKVAIIAALNATDASLPGISAALARYRASPSVDNACRSCQQDQVPPAFRARHYRRG